MQAFQVDNVSDEVGITLDPLEGMETAGASVSRATATRPKSLDGQTLAVIDNRAGGRFREILVQRLTAECGFKDVLLVIKDTVNVPPRPEDWAEVIKRGTVGLALYGA